MHIFMSFEFMFDIVPFVSMILLYNTDTAAYSLAKSCEPRPI